MAREPLPRFTAQRRSLQNCAAPIMPRWLNIVACRFVRCFVAAALALPAVAAPVRTAHVEAELVPEQSALSPGRPLTVALRLGWSEAGTRIGRTRANPDCRPHSP